MKRVLSTIAVFALLAGLAGLAVLARPGGTELSSPARTASALAAPAAQGEDSGLAAQGAAPEALAAAGKYNMLGLPLIISSITDAASLEGYIESNTPTTVGRLLKWDAMLGGTGGYFCWDPADEEGSLNFPISVGDAFWLLSVGTGTPVLSYVGDVPAQHSVTFALIGSSPSCRYNMITVPLDKGGISTAEGLAADIGVGDVGRLLSWDPALGGVGGYYSYDPGDPEGSFNFDVRIGYPYWVCMKASKTWPQWP